MGRIVDRRRVMSGKALPYDYEVEYIESTNNGEKIVTSVKSSDFDELTITFEFDQFLNIRSFLFGVTGTGTGYCAVSSNGKLESLYPLTRISTGTHTLTIKRVSSSSNGMLDGVPAARCMIISNKDTYPTNLLALYVYEANVSNIPTSPLRIFSCKLSKNNIAVLDFIPVVKDNIGYMYDKVSGQLYGNAGTGSFIVGPRV